MHPENNPERRALDFRLYRGLEKKQAEQQLADDLASLFLEISADSSQRITPYTWLQTDDDRVIVPEFSQDRDLEETLSWETPADILESKVALKIRDYLLSQNETPFIVVWVSPPNKNLGYPEGRIVAGIGQEKDSLRFIESYGICIDLSPTICVLLGQNLQTLSQNPNGSSIDSADQLRATPLFLKPPDNTDPLDYLANLIPLPDVWEKIKSGEAKVLKEQALSDARVIVEALTPQINHAQEDWEFVQLGIEAEQFMMSQGWSARSQSGCGALNSELSASGSFTYNHTHVSVDQYGNTASKKSESGTFVKNCPYCGQGINKVIHTGYTCACGQTYLGVC